MSGSLADLYVVLSMQIGSFVAGAEEAASAGEEMAEKLTAGMDDGTAAADRLGEAATEAAETVVAAEDAMADAAARAAEAAAEATTAQETQGDSTATLAGLEKELADAVAASAEAQDRLAAASRESTAAGSEYAEALDRASAASDRMLDAQVRLGDAELTAAREAQAAGDAQDEAAAKTDTAAESAATAGGHFKLLGLALAAGAALSIKMAGTFQQSMTRLVTSAGESQKNLQLVSQGIISMSTATNTSTQQLAQGMYYVESAGFHGAQGLTVLKAAAEGAQAEGAELGTVANAVTSALNAYGLKASSATAVTDELVAAVGRGKMTMQDLASSIAQVLPVAAKAHISLAQVTGAIATMTSQGMSAQQSAQNLRHTILSLQSPTTVQTAEMQQMGINSLALSKNLGHAGLTGTIEQLEQSILQHMGPAGTVLLKAFNQSKLAAQSAQTEIAAMPPSLQKLARAYEEGKISAAKWQQTVTKGSLPADQANLLKQFAATTNAAHGFNNMLRSGQGDAQTFTAALSKMMGGTTGLQVALMVGGGHMATFKSNVDGIAGSAAHAGKNVDNWGLIQKNFNFQLGSAEKSAQAVAISFGQALLPSVTSALHVVTSFMTMLSRHTATCKALAIAVGVVLAGALEHGLVKALKSSVSGFADMWKAGSKITGFFKVGEEGASKFGTMISKIGSVSSKVWSGISTAAQTSWSAVTSAASASWSAITRGASAAWEGITSGLSKVSSVGKSAWSGLQSAWEGLKGLFTAGTAATEAQTAAEELQTAATTEQAAATEEAAVAQEGLDVAMDANPIGIIIVAVAALVAGFILLWTHCKAFRDFWIDTWHDVEHIIGAAVDWIKAHWMLLAAILLGPIAIAAALIFTHLHQIEHFFEAAWDYVTSTVSEAWSKIKDLVNEATSWVVNFIEQGWQRLVNVTKSGWNDVTSTISAAWDNIKTWVDNATEWVWQKIQDAWNTVSNLTRTGWDDITRAVNTGITTILNWVDALPGKIVSGLGDLASDLYSAGEHAIQGLLNGMESMVSGAVSKAASMGHDIVNALGSAFGIHFSEPSPAYKVIAAGRNVGRDLAAGLLANRGLVTTAAAALGAAGMTSVTGGHLAAVGATAAAAYAGAGGGTANVNLTISPPGAGFIGSPQELATALRPVIQRALAQYFKKNGDSGIVPAH